jgi:hypothetical protein
VGTKKLALRSPINPRILDAHAQRVMVDADLAEIYGVGTKRLNEALKRNAGKFPPDFMFVLTDQALAATRIHRAWRLDGRHRAQQPTRGGGVYLRGAHVQAEDRDRVAGRPEFGR